MKSYLVYKFEDGPQQLKAEAFLRDIGADVRPRITEINADSVDGGHLSQLYQIIDYPAFLITMDDGQLVRLYQQKWPLLSEIRYHMNPQI